MVNRLQHLLALIEDEKMQCSLIDLHDDIADYPLDEALLTEVRERQQLMRRYDLSYFHAFTLPADLRKQLLENANGVAVWLLQAQQQVFALGVPAEVIERISSYVLGLESRCINAVHDTVAKKVYRGAKRHVDVKYRDSWHAWLLGKRIGYPAMHRSKVAELEEIGMRNQLNNH